MPGNPARRKKRFAIVLSDVDEVRIEFEREANTVTRFSVQYLAKIGGKWHPVLRFDTAHGQPHMDIVYPDGTKETRFYPFHDYNTAFTYAITYVKEHWQEFRERYERHRRWTGKNNSGETTSY